MTAETTERIGLTELVELSIGSPEKGAVNFNLIKAVLQILIGRLEAEDEKLSIEFRGPSADLVRNLRENFSAQAHFLDMTILSEKDKPELIHAKIETDLKEVKLDIMNLQERLDKMTYQITALTRKIINSIHVTPFLMDNEPLDENLLGNMGLLDDKELLNDEKMKDALWLPHESGYKTEPSQSGKLKLDGNLPKTMDVSLQRLDESFTQMEDRLPKLEEKLPQMNVNSPKHDDRMQQIHKPFQQYEKILNKQILPESLPQLNEIWSSNEPMGQNLGQESDRLQTCAAPLQDEKEVKLWNYMGDYCDTIDPFKSKTDDTNVGSKNNNDVIYLHKKCSDKSVPVRKTTRQTQSKGSISSDESKLKLRTKFPVKTTTRRTTDNNHTNKEERTESVTEGKKKTGFRVNIQDSKGNTATPTVEKPDKRTIITRERIKESLRKSDITNGERTEETPRKCSDLNGKDRLLSEIDLKTEQQMDEIEPMHANTIHINTRRVNADNVSVTNVKVDKNDKPDPSAISAEVFPVSGKKVEPNIIAGKVLPVPAKAKLNKREKQDLATQMKSINLSSLYGRNRHCGLDDPDYLTSDMYDDKGLLKPMYDTGCFQSAYVEALKKYSSSTTRTESHIECPDVSERDKGEILANGKKYNESFLKMSTKEQVIVHDGHIKHNSIERWTFVPQQRAMTDVNSEHVDGAVSNKSKHTLDGTSDHKPMPTDVQKYLFGSVTSSRSSNSVGNQTESIKEVTSLNNIKTSKIAKNAPQTLSDKKDTLKDKGTPHEIKNVRFTQKVNRPETAIQSSKVAKSILKQTQIGRGMKKSSDTSVQSDVDKSPTKVGRNDVRAKIETINRQQKAISATDTGNRKPNKFVTYYSSSQPKIIEKLPTQGLKQESHTQLNKNTQPIRSTGKDPLLDLNSNKSSQTYQGNRPKPVVERLKKFEAANVETHKEAKNESKPIHVSESAWQETNEKKDSKVKDPNVEDNVVLHSLEDLTDFFIKIVRSELSQHGVIINPTLDKLDREVETRDKAIDTHDCRQQVKAPPETENNEKQDYKSESQFEIPDGKCSNEDQNDETVATEDSYVVEPTKLDTGNTKLDTGNVPDKNRMNKTTTTVTVRAASTVVPKPFKRPPGRRGPRPKLVETSSEDTSMGHKDLPRAFTTASRKISLNVLHVNSNYDDTDNTVSSSNLERMIGGITESADDLSTIFPQRKKFYDLDRVVSDLLNNVTAAEYDPFKQGTGDALNIIMHILDHMLDTPAAMPQDDERVTALERRVDDLETEVFKINSRLHESKLSTQGAAAPGGQGRLHREAVDAIKHLQRAMKEALARLDTIHGVTDQNQLCLESLFDVVRGLDGRKVDRQEMEEMERDIIQRSGVEMKVDVEEYRREMRRLTEALGDARAKQDLHRKFQLLQCDVTNKIFELLPSKLGKSEYNSLMEDKMRSALTQMEDRLNQMVQNKDRNASGARNRVVLKDLLCISCNNDVVMQDTCSGSYINAPFHACQHKSLRLNKDTTKLPKDQWIVQNRYCGATVKMTAAQKLALGKRYPFGQYGDLTPPQLSTIAKKYLESDPLSLSADMTCSKTLRRSLST